jgi:hypothetical protein
MLPAEFVLFWALSWVNLGYQSLKWAEHSMTSFFIIKTLFM